MKSTVLCSSRVTRAILRRDIAANHLERRTGCSAAYVIAHLDKYGPIDRMLAFKCSAANLAAMCFK